MNRRHVEIFGLLFVALIAHAALAAAEDKPTAYANKEYNFRLSYPQKLKPMEPPNPRTILFLATESDGPGDVFRESVTFKKETNAPLAGVTFEQALNGMLGSMAKNGLKVLESQPAKLGGARAQRVIYTHPLKLPGGEVTAKCVMYFVDLNDQPYSLDVRATDKTYDAFLPVAQQVVDSFAWDAGDPAGAKDAAPAPAAAADGSGVYENKEFDVRFKYPAGLTPTETPGAANGVVLAGPPDAAGKRDVIVLSVQTTERASKPGYVKTVAGVVAQGLSAKGATDMKSAETKLGARPAHEISCTMPVANASVKIRQLLVANGKRLYTFQAVASGERFDALSAQFTRLTESIEFISEAPAAAVVNAGGVQFNVPAGWASRKPADAKQSAMLTPDGNAAAPAPSAPFIALSVQPAAAAAPQPLELLKQSLAAFKAQTSPDARLVESQEAKVGGEAGRYAVMQGKAKGGEVDVKSMTWVVIRANGTVVTFTAQASAAEFDKTRAALEAVAGTVQFVTK